MLRVTAASLCAHGQRMRHHRLLLLLLQPPPASASTLTSPSRRPENRHTVDSLYRLSVDVQKVRRLRGWILREASAFVSETADLLRDLGADGAAIARVLQTHPEAVLCRPEDAAAQRDLWGSVFPSRRELLAVVEKFPASFFTLTQSGNQRANVRYLRSLRLSRATIGGLMASAPQSLSRPVERNQEVLHTLRETYLDLGGDAGDLLQWLQTLLAQNPRVLLQPAEAWRDGLGYLRGRGFTTEELLHLASGLSASVAELQPDAMQQALAYVEELLACSEEELRRTVIRCPAILTCPLPALVGRCQGLMDVGVSAEQVKECPNVLELPTQAALYRVDKLASRGHDVRAGSLAVVVGTEEEFEATYRMLQLRQRRPLRT